MSEVIKILLVEDDEDDYFLTSDYLAQCESPTFELTWVTNSLDAVEALKTQSFDLCLLDYLLGAENAIDVLGVLKSNQFNLPVVTQARLRILRRRIQLRKTHQSPPRSARQTHRLPDRQPVAELRRVVLGHKQLRRKPC